MRICCITLSFMFVSRAYSQEADSTIRSTTDPVVITASRMSLPISNSMFTVDLIDSQALSKINNVLTIKEALSEIPSVLTNNRFNMAQGDRITIRGTGTRAQFGVRGIKVLLDGIPLTFVDGQSQLNNLNITSLDKIEVIRGASSSLYGNSSGGIISAKSSIGNTNNLSIRPTLSLGSFGLSNYGLGVSAPLLSGGVSFNGYITNSKGYRNHADAKFGGIKILTDHTIASEFSLNTVVNYYNAPYLLNPSSLNKDDAVNNPTNARDYIVSQGAGKKVTQLQVGVSFSYLLSGKTEIKSTIFGINRNLLNSIPSEIIDLNRFAGGVRLEFVTNQELADIKYRLLVGVDYESQNDERKEYENLGLGENVDINPEDLFDNLNYGSLILDQNENVSGLGTFSQIEIKPSDHITFFLGARYDNYNFHVEDQLTSDGVNNSDEIKMNNLSPTVGISFSYLTNQWIYTNYSTAFQTPTTNELSNNPESTGGFNKNLNPEFQKGFEIGLRGELILSRLYYNFTLFSYDISNMLIPYQNSDEVTFYRNAGEAKNRGGEIFVKWWPSALINLSASYSFMNFKYTDLMIQYDDQIANVAGNYVPGVPKNSLNFSISSSFPHGISTNINFSWTDKYFANDFNGPKPNIVDDEENYVNDEYFLTNIGLLYRLNVNWLKLSVKLGVENVFNLRYNDSIVPNAFGNNFFEPASGRAWYFSTTLEF